jgi:hypothetical protein
VPTVFVYNFSIIYRTEIISLTCISQLVVVMEMLSVTNEIGTGLLILYDPHASEICRGRLCGCEWY